MDLWILDVNRCNLPGWDGAKNRTAGHVLAYSYLNNGLDKCTYLLNIHRWTRQILVCIRSMHSGVCRLFPS